MGESFLKIACLLVALPGAIASAQQSQLVNNEECAACHAQIYANWQRTGMGRSFARVQPGENVERFYHPASDTYYSMKQRGGQYYQRRWQVGFDGNPTNIEELEADLVLGSGNHARTYLHRTDRGTLIELPLGWYAEKGGYWALNPGYDAAHPPSHRLIGYECMFCHNAYPQIPSGSSELGGEPVYVGKIPDGIDCQRCHGPGANHVRSPVPGSIVNPARLSKVRQMEVCMQCHLETTSTRLPSLMRRFGRGPFDFLVGQPLGDFEISFDHAPGSGYADKFEIASGAYRLRQSQCFLKSKGEMTCTTCHNPHNAPRGEGSQTHYASVCRQCHGTTVDRLTSAGTHTANGDCVSCHMPKRRTDDAVHVVMTDHRIQRRAPDRDLLAEQAEKHPAKEEEYRGEVVPYYPSPLPASDDTELYVALAQVRDGRNLAQGIPPLTGALERAKAPRPEFYLALGDAWHAAGTPAKAVPAYQRAVKLQPNSARAWRYLGVALHESGEPKRASEALKRAAELAPADAHVWLELSLIASEKGSIAESLAALEKARALDPDLPEVWIGIGVNRMSTGEIAKADEAFRQALRIDPYDAAANGNLANLLAASGDLSQATYYFEKAARLQPSGAVNLYEYALALVRMSRFEDSQREAEAALRADANLAEAHELLGGLLARKKEIDAALREYREAVRLKPEFGRAQLDLGATLAARGDITEAVTHFREAAKSTDPRVARPAAKALQEIGADR